MKDKILEVINKHPKHYTRIIKSNQEMSGWVYKNNKAITDHFPTMIYSAIYSVSNICPNGKEKQFDRFSTGFINCGPASVCACTKNDISKNVSITKLNTNATKKKISNDKRAKTMLKKYGVEHNLQRQEVKAKLQLPKIKETVFGKLSDYTWLHTEYVINNRSAVDIAAELNVYYGTVIDYCRRFNIPVKQHSNYSLVEQNILDYVRSLGVVAIPNDRTILNKQEIDILIPEKNIAIEVNGLYWHSFNPSLGKKEERNKHVNKTILASKKNIQLLHFTDWDWYNKQDIVKSIIKSKLGLTDRIYARKCNIKECVTSEAKRFFTENHLQGFAAGKKYIGLYHNNKLVQCIVLGKNRYNKGVELIRLATLQNITVVGGFSKLLRYSNEPEIHTYCDIDISNGRGYIAVGFKETGSTGPGYFWTNGTNKLSRYMCQKSKLLALLGNKFDPNKSEAENMFNAGYRRYWNCGNYKLVFTQ